jgi:CHAD domain-containing protein
MDQQQPTHLFGARDPDAPRELNRRLAGETLVERADHLTRLRFCDTFDWRLHARGWTLIQTVNALELRDLATGDLVAGQDWPGNPLPPFPRRWPDGAVRDLLLPIADVRALLHLITVEGMARVLAYTDPRSQRAWRIIVSDLRQVRGDASRPFLHTVSLAPRDGRARGGNRLGRLVRSCGYRTLEPTLFGPAMGRAGLTPGGYRKTFDLELGARERAGSAFARIAADLIGRLEANRRGVERDIDPEFLHDFRVATRRLRVLLAVGKGVIAADVRREARERFTALGKATNRLRDLDVYLMRRAEVRSLVPPGCHDGVDTIFARAADARTACRRELDARLADPGFPAVLAWGRRVLTVPAEPPPPRARRRIGKVADKLILTSFARVRARGDGLGDDAADADLHRLRIACKRHRYLVEFFASLYPAARVAAHLKSLRSLQNVLGDHNDAVQELAELAGFVTAGDGTDAAAEAIRGELENQRRSRRDAFPDAYRKVAGPGCRRGLRAMLRARRRR